MVKKKIAILAAAGALTFGIGGYAALEQSHAVTASQAQQLPELREGQTDSSVIVLQHMLNAHGADLEVDGYYGPVTTAAASEYQRANGLTQDGWVGAETWASLLPDLKEGANNDSVASLQRILAHQGIDVVVDGDYGPKTTAAVQEFQEREGLIVDGWVGADTWAALMGAPESNTPTDPPTTPPSDGEWVLLDQTASSQWGQVACGPTSTLMVLVRYGVDVEGYNGPNDYAGAIDNLAAQMGTTQANGTDNGQVEAVLTEHGLHEKETQDEAEALAAVRDGKPVIMNGLTGNLSWWNGDFAHFIVVTGYDADSDTYTVLDPGQGKHDATADELTRFGDSYPHGASHRAHHIVKA